MKSYLLYASGTASRIINFFHGEGLGQHEPKTIVYDGTDYRTREILADRFREKVKFIKPEFLTVSDTKRINKYTSSFIEDLMSQENIDYMLCFGNRIFQKQFVESYDKRLINFHPSLLPSFKGLNAIDRALERKVRYIGNTAHFMASEIDSGQIIAQSIMRSSEVDTYEDVLELQYPLLRVVFDYILSDQQRGNTWLNQDLKHRKKFFDVTFNEPKNL